MRKYLRAGVFLILAVMMGYLIRRSTDQNVKMVIVTGQQEEMKRVQTAGIPAEEIKTKGIKSEAENADSDFQKLALTFDDGPHPFYTEQLLDGLAKRSVKGTFFVTGENAELYPELIQRMNEEGHLIGNHTYSHIQLRQGNREAFRKELVQTNQIIEQITGKEVTYVRPPYGTWDKSFEKELNMIPVLWTIDPLDWCCQDASCIIRKVECAAQENAIILLHDSYPATVTAALQIVDDLQKEGYTFVTVEEILFD